MGIMILLLVARVGVWDYVLDVLGHAQADARVLAKILVVILARGRARVAEILVLVLVMANVMGVLMLCQQRQVSVLIVALILAGRGLSINGKI